MVSDFLLDLGTFGLHIYVGGQGYGELSGVDDETGSRPFWLGRVGHNLREVGELADKRLHPGRQSRLAVDDKQLESVALRQVL